MKKIRWLGILVVMVLLVSFGVGTVASANTITQKTELKSFLENFITINQLPEDNPFFRINTLQWLIETDGEFIKEGSCIIEFTPLGVKELFKDGQGYYHIEVVVHRYLIITPKENVKIDGREITLSVEVLVRASYKNQEGLHEFLKEILKAIDEEKTVSIEIKVPTFYCVCRPIDERTIKEEIHPEYLVSFYKK